MHNHNDSNNRYKSLYENRQHYLWHTKAFVRPDRFIFFFCWFFFTAWKISVLRLDSCVLKEQFTKSLKFSHHLLPPLPDWAWGVLSFLFVFYVTTRLDKVNVSCSLSYGRYHSYSSTDVYPDYRRVQRRRSLKLYCVLKADVSESEPSLDIVFRVFYIHTYIWGFSWLYCDGTAKDR